MTQQCGICGAFIAHLHAGRLTTCKRCGSEWENGADACIVAADSSKAGDSTSRGSTVAGYDAEDADALKPKP